jgi:hypothetical protein
LSDRADEAFGEEITNKIPEFEAVGWATAKLYRCAHFTGISSICRAGWVEFSRAWQELVKHLGLAFIKHAIRVGFS